MTPAGLSTPQAHERLKQYGPNTITASSSVQALQLFLSQFPTLMNIILFLAGAVSLAIGNLLDFLFIMATLFLNALFGFVQEYKAEKSLEKLKQYTQPVVRVLRDGKEQELQASLLVPDDHVLLQEGDRIPADGLLLHAVSLEIDESILTGESLPVRKQTDDTVFSGTLVTKGRATVRITATGMKTRFGQIAQTLKDIRPEKTPLEQQLASLGKSLSLIAVSLALLLIPIGLLQQKELGEVLLLAASIGIAAIPEGLPAVITIALAIGTSRMAKKKALVRQMPAIETLGSMQVVLVDKTGTLTQNRMAVKKVWCPQDRNVAHMVEASLLGNTASLIQNSDGKATVTGDKTDGALLLWAKQQNESIAAHLEQGKVIDEFVFDNQTKTITTVWQGPAGDHVFVRGAPEVILQKSTLTQDAKEQIQKEYEAYAKEGLRVIAFGSKSGKFAPGISRQEHEKGLTFLGFVGIYDPPRKEVKTVISQARQAGIRVIMVTGDNELTASSIAKEIGLISHDEPILTGEELSRLTDVQLVPLLQQTHVFARTKPEDKLRIATLLQQQNLIVGVTGDGVNDALALKKANVGVAMGQSGTDVAKEASDIIVTDDDFATLMSAVAQGRSIYRNILTAITYLLATNLSELCLVLFGTILNLPTILLPTQILWINLVTDSLPALALATDRPFHHVLSQKPRDPGTPILTRNRFFFLVAAGVFMALLLILLYGISLQSFSQQLARSIVFNGLVALQLIFALLVRRQSLLKITPFLLLTLLVTVGLQVVATFLPFFQNIFQLGLE